MILFDKPRHLPAIDAQNGAVEENVLPAGQVGVKAGAELQQRGDATADGDVAAGRIENASDYFEQRALARPVWPDNAQCVPGPNCE